MRIAFDLFGTLVRSQGGPIGDAHWRDMAVSVLDVDRKLFISEFRKSIPERETGVLEFVPAVLQAVERAGGSPDTYQAQKCFDVSVTLLAEYLNATIRPHVLETLKLLQNRGMSLVLLSNASQDTSFALRRWDASPLFDQMIVSSDIGFTKPDIRAYQACGLDAGDMFVGDGGSDELNGARDTSLRAVQVSELRYDGTVAFRAGWEGERVGDLPGLLQLIE